MNSGRLIFPALTSHSMAGMTAEGKRREQDGTRQDFRELKILFLDDGSASQVGVFVTLLNIM